MDTGSNLSLQIIEFVYMLVVDLMFLVGLVILMLPLGIWRQAAFAVMKRNFVGYFSNPTGYVFLCLFVLLTSFAAFWPHEFFTTNLANFDQLNKFLPYIMLVFIPAITMSIWAEERRQGTDELLLTLPAKDFDIVIGKYFAAVLVFTVSLLFSQLSNYTVLLTMTGGELDNLLLFSTYLGYWFVGVAMIALGMVASFLTKNLTVGFIFGAALNAPLVFFSNADVIFSDSLWIQRLFDWSLLQRFEPFGRGLISMPSIFYFLGIVVVGVYLSLILIGRRHWLGGRDGTSLLWHYVARAGLVAVIAISGVLIVQHNPLLSQARVDISARKINTLAPVTIEMLDRFRGENADDTAPVVIEAYISNNLPSEFVRMKYDLVNLLREFDARGGNRVNVTLHLGIDPFSQEAINAEKKYGIRPVKIRSEQRGATREEEVVLGVAFSCGIERIVLPFINYGVPVEYELMRSINTVSQPERKTIGVVQTDLLPFGGSIQTKDQTLPISKLRIITELEKQYRVELVDARNPIPLFTSEDDGTVTGRRYDALVVLQPSMTTQQELQNIIYAIQSGQPTAVFEDPLPNPVFFSHIRGSMMPRLLGRGGTEAADIQRLWNVLEMRPGKRRLKRQRSTSLPAMVWSESNPYPRDPTLALPEHLVIQQQSERDPRFAVENPITRDIDQLYFQFVGYFEKDPRGKKLEYTELVNSGPAGVTAPLDFVQARNQEEMADVMEIESQGKQYQIAAEIRGENADSSIPTNTNAVTRDGANINVVYIADVDTMHDSYMAVRDAPVRGGVEYRYQNVSFVLNILDSLTQVDTYLELRNRRFNHVTLERLEEVYMKAMDEVAELDTVIQKTYLTELSSAEESVKAATTDLEERIKREKTNQKNGKTYDPRRLASLEQLLLQRRREQATKFENKRRELENARNEQKREIDLKAELQIQEAQRNYKLAAVIIPPIPPLLVGLFVFARRRLREREGISKARRLR